MAKRPDFDLKKVVDEECFKKCTEFLPKFRESNKEVESKVKSGKLDLLDSKLEFCNDNESTGFKLEEDQGEESIVLDVGLGVFDVKGEEPSEDALRKAGVSVIDMKEDLQMKKEEPLIMEVKTRRSTKKK